MYLNCQVKIPEADGKISKKLIKGTTYIYYEYASNAIQIAIILTKTVYCVLPHSDNRCLVKEFESVWK